MSELPIAPAHRRLLTITASATFLLVSLGSVVCITNASGGCPDWPRCHGRLVPPMQMDSILEYMHRVVALITGPLILATAIAGLRRREKIVRWLPWIAVVLTIAVAIFGAFAVLTGLPPLLAALDLSSALGVVSLMIIAAVVASTPAIATPRSRGLVTRLALVSLGAMFVYFVSGVLLAGGSIMRCVGGPMQLAASTDAGVLTTARGVVGAAAALLIAATSWATATSNRLDVQTRRWGFAAGALVVLAVVFGGAIAMSETRAGLLIASATVSAALWSAMVVVATRASLVEQPAVAVQPVTVGTTPLPRNSK